MELLTRLVIVLLVCAKVIADNIADEGRSKSYEDLQSQIKINEEKCRKTEAEIQLLEEEIADLDEKMSHDQKMDELNRNSYFTGILRSTLLGIYPTLCLPDGKVTGIHNIKLDNESFEVACDGEIAEPGWIVIQRRTNDNLDFNRGWKEYENGFGNISGSFFIGLKKLHKLTSMMPHELYIHLESLSGEIRYANYNHFEIGSRFTYYKLISLGLYNGTAGDAFNYALYNEFMVNLDRDFFGDSTNVNTGWWISYDQSRIGSNLNAAHSQWQPWPTSFRSVQMMIRPNLKSVPSKCEPKKESWFRKIFSC